MTSGLLGAVRGRLAALVGGQARLRVVGLLAAVLALDGADKGTVGATASNLQAAFGIDNTEIGLLVSVSTLMGAVATIPVGALSDRVCRTRLLAGSILLWGAATAVEGCAQSYQWLLLSRIALGAVIATAGPTVASLAGDWFRAADRARLYGYVLVGEIAGSGLGLVVSSWLASLFGWRAGFWWLVLPSLVLAAVVWRVAEPDRGGQSRPAAGQLDMAESSTGTRPGEPADAAVDAKPDDVRKTVVAKHIEPYDNQVLRRDPQRSGLWWAVGYVLRIRTDVVIIVVSSLGYFYFGGVRAFGILFAQAHYGVAKGVASTLLLIIGVGAVCGALLGGRVADRLLARGVVHARVLVPALVLFAIPLLLGPGFWISNVWIAVPLLMAGATLLGAANPPQDAARLDVIHPHLWGRSEGVRTALRQSLEAAAPLTFGWVSDHFFGSKVNVAAATTGRAGTAAQGRGLSLTFVLFLGVLFLAALIALIGLRTYPRDVATAQASIEATTRNTTAKAGA